MFADILVLAAAGIAAASGLMLAGWCASLGVFARLIGLAAAILYTAIWNSWIGGGQTAGKRLFAIQVAGADGRPVSFGRSLTRSVVLWIALAQSQIVRDIALQSGSTAAVLGTLFVVSALALGIAYLLVFNRPTRQGLHDLIASTVVVKKRGLSDITAAPLARVHKFALASLVIFAAILVMIQAPSQRKQFADFQRFEDELRQVAGFHQLRHFEASDTSLDIGVQLARPPASFEAVQRQVAGIVLGAYPLADRLEHMRITIGCTCDLGVLGRLVKWGGVLEESRDASLADWRRTAAR
jgi:uncharacterized RDD family membrane protein YckC